MDHASNLKVCIDLSSELSGGFPGLYSLYNAYSERGNNILNESSKNIIDSNEDVISILNEATNKHDYPSLLIHNRRTIDLLLELALLKNQMWDIGKVLNVRFLGGDPYIHRKVVHYAKTWEQFANITFNFINSGEAEIRIDFTPGTGSWSYVGTDALTFYNEQDRPTMNFGWFDRTTSENEFSRTIIHEFGHCLGCIHEHQSPAANINWRKEYVYDYYYRTQGWARQKVDVNLFQKFTEGEISNSYFDPHSIMLYPIPLQFTTDGFSVGWNNLLSTTDIEFIGRKYPRQ